MARTRSKSKSKFKSKSKSKSKSRSGSSLKQNSRIRNIFSIPRSNGQIPKMLNNDRDIKKVVVKLNNNKEEVARLFLAITAKWCGACHAVSDRLNKAIKRSNMAATRIDEQNVPRLNTALNSSIEPPHYPYFIVVDQQAQIQKILSSIEEVEQFLASSVDEQSLNNEEESSETQPLNNKEASPKEKTPSPSNNGTEPRPVNKSITAPIPDKSLSVRVEEEEEQEEEQEEEEEEENKEAPPAMPVKSTTLNNVGKLPSANASATALPPNAQKMDRLQAPPPSEPLSPAQGGGSLYASLASTAYQLAPPAVLLGIAAATLKRKSKKRSKRRTQRK